MVVWAGGSALGTHRCDVVMVLALRDWVTWHAFVRRDSRKSSSARARARVKDQRGGGETLRRVYTAVSMGTAHGGRYVLPKARLWDRQDIPYLLNVKAEPLFPRVSLHAAGHVNV